MIFDSPRFLLLLILLIPIAIMMIFRYQKCRNAADLFAASASVGKKDALVKEYRSRMVYSDCFFVLFLGFLILSLAGPRWGEELVADYRRGVDVVLALDISRSMNVRDCPPLPGNQDAGQNASRLERALALARDLALGLNDIRIGTAIGKGRGILAVPLTYDSEAVLNFLDSLDSFAVTGTGTDLDSLITAASGAFKDNMPGRRGILLLTDGEIHSGTLEGALKKAQDAGIVLCAAGLGTEDGGPVPVEAGADAPNGVLLSANGLPVISTRRGEFLKNSVEKTGGIYIDGNRNDAAAILHDYFKSLSADSGLSGHRRESKARWQLFVLAALVSFGVSRFLGVGRRKKKIFPVLLCLFALSGISCSRTEGKLLIMEGNFFNSRGLYTEAISSYLKAMDYDDAAPYAEYGLGSAYWALEESQAALERYAAAEKVLALGGDHPELRYRIQYNSGIIYFEKREYEQAAKAFRGALEIDGSRIEAKRNLELSLLTLDRASSSQASTAEGVPETGNTGEGSDSPILYNYLRQREQDQWKSREWAKEDDTSGPDY
ncbi:VWA domain-containing protein [Leadbettera azotonutricia]|uniref:Tetratricopeptide repeat domain protein n=1 Tax=Leadbettera azotonutricia (strain ATCC BAA-888 / DSM 13862 / ZAS-9) TaxID=545695 RepID=F5Y7Q8_LEAAZ|nr:VWA domain-containing protein [Leadbettera azotonutricia]AEF80805.1 tetratricopeptide repeat domain protein [Leadbettera azotonutricia ZAS-9]